MELLELKGIIESAIDRCQSIILERPNIVLSESDFERLLSYCISKRLSADYLNMPSEQDFSVHSQISHYFGPERYTKLDRRVDILLLKESGLDKGDWHKGFKYSSDSFAIELKYLHETDPISKVECDFCKWRDLKNDSWLYVVVLLDVSCESTYTEKENIIKKMYEKHKDSANDGPQFDYKVLRKNVTF